MLKRIVYILAVNIFILIFLLEIFSRLFLTFRRNADFDNPKSVSNFYFPELKKINTSQTKEKELSLLLLGASVLNSAWGSVEKEIIQNFKNKKSLKIKVTNVSIPAHTTRDSLLKYQLLEEEKFDVVFLYHGINDVRMNNYPEEYYKDDYSHIQWYREVNLLTKYRELEYYATPYTLNVAWNKLFHKNLDDSYESYECGSDIKTNYAFYQNIDEIINIAKKREQVVLLGTYAYYQDRTYSRDGFESKELDYSRHKLPIEVWGKPVNVSKNIIENNNIIRTLAKQNNLDVIDFEKMIPKNKNNFDDCCHLTNEGSRLFANLVVKKILDINMYGRKN